MGGTELNRPELCIDCKGKCCTDPFLSMDEYIRLVAVIGNEKAQAARPELIAGGWRFREHPCPGLTESGCVLPYNDRPLICKTYPFLLIPAIGGRHVLVLAPRTCPKWKEFGELYWDQVKEIETMGVKIG